MMIQYSVLISVYYKEQPEFLRQALDSMFGQTVPPDEVVLVCDGPLTIELDQVIQNFQHQYESRFKVLRLKKNMGLGNALKQGVQVCSYEWIARMDSDDISLPNRMEKQLSYIQRHPEVSVVGGQIIEFEGDISNPVDMRCVPLDMLKIRQTLRFKNPMNHVTVVFKKSAILAVGNYENRIRFEDYQLWAKLVTKGYQLANIPDCCCYVRTGIDAYQRRGGFSYFCNAVDMQNYMLEHKLISLLNYIRNLAVWFAVSVLLPNKVRGFLSKKIMRNKIATRENLEV